MPTSSKRFYADLHIHSRFSRATSKQLTVRSLAEWAGRKGIAVVGTGDCVHPRWLDEIAETLVESSQGLFREKTAPQHGPHFILSTEISSIYKKNGKVRKVHSVCLFPGIKAVRQVQKRLDQIGNIVSDGRPILKLDPKDLLSILLATDERCMLIPAHIWTPWFSVLGAKSGFDSIEECFEDMAQHVYALETGLSSDPAMNRRCSILDRFRLVSNSDAHSPQMLGREATIFDGAQSYDGILQALKTGTGYVGTVEFYPEEGKYHYDGHRVCDICWTPEETAKHKGLCPVCGSPVTPGVMGRVHQLADRAQPVMQRGETSLSLTPLVSVIAQIEGVSGTASKKVRGQYDRMIAAIGPEFFILLEADLALIAKETGERYAHAIGNMRSGRVKLTPGYDGVFGRVKVV